MAPSLGRDGSLAAALLLHCTSCALFTVLHVDTATQFPLTMCIAVLNMQQGPTIYDVMVDISCPRCKLMRGQLKSPPLWTKFETLPSRGGGGGMSPWISQVSVNV